MRETALLPPMPSGALARSVAWGLLAFGMLLGLYLSVVALISGADFGLSQFRQFWYYLVPLAAGFGVQVTLFAELREIVRRSKESGAVLAASGGTSTAAMISCCAHYLANVAPVLGATGLVAFAAQFQVELFWAGLAFNAAGIAYMAHKLSRARREHARCLA